MSEINNDDLPIKVFLKGREGSAKFQYGKFHILMSCHRIIDKKIVAQFVADKGLDKPASSHTIKKFGFRIELTDEKAEIFRNSKFDVSVGSARWAYNIRRGTNQASQIFSISIQVYAADKPHEVDFTTVSRINAAMAIYNEAVEKAQLALRQEILRIYSIAEEERLNPIYRPEVPANPNIPDEEPVKKKTKAKEPVREEKPRKKPTILLRRKRS